MVNKTKIVIYQNEELRVDYFALSGLSLSFYSQPGPLAWATLLRPFGAKTNRPSSGYTATNKVESAWIYPRLIIIFPPNSSLKNPPTGGIVPVC